MVKFRVKGTREGLMPAAVELRMGERDVEDSGENVEVTGVLVVGVRYRRL